MRILFIHNYYKQAGGEDQVVANEMELLQERGHELALLDFHNDELSAGLSSLPAFFYSKSFVQRIIRFPDPHFRCAK